MQRNATRNHFFAKTATDAGVIHATASDAGVHLEKYIKKLFKFLSTYDTRDCSCHGGRRRNQ